MSMFNSGGSSDTKSNKRDLDKAKIETDQEQMGRGKRHKKATDLGPGMLNAQQIDDRMPPTDEELAEFEALEEREAALAEGEARSTGGISGESRTDANKTACAGRTKGWTNPTNRWPTNAGYPKKRTWIAIRAVPNVGARKPTQSSVMWHARGTKVSGFKMQAQLKAANTKPPRACIKAVSPNELAGYTNYQSDQHGSYEWLHLIANSLGGPDSFSYPRSGLNVSANNAQDVANLVLGTFGANTFMMAIEAAVDGKAGLHYCVESFSPSDPDVAQWIRVSLCKGPCQGSPTGNLFRKCRHYWIDAEMQVCPRTAFDNMKADAIQFVADDTLYLGESDYAYPAILW